MLYYDRTQHVLFTNKYLRIFVNVEKNVRSDIVEY